MSASTTGAGRYDEAIRYAREALHRRSEIIDGAIVLASALGYLGQAEEARTTIERQTKTAVEYIENHAMFAQDLKDSLLEGLRRANIIR